MKFNIAFLVFLTTILCSSVYAQSVTDEELKKYVIAMDSLETLKVQLTTAINNLSKSNTKISSNRFNELMPIINNEAKLTEAKATPDEIAYVKKAVATRDEETMNFQKTFQSLINDYVGEAVFTKVRNGIRTDASLKKKYDSLMAKPR
jgi:oligoendopeptidase F